MADQHSELARILASEDLNRLSTNVEDRRSQESPFLLSLLENVGLARSSDFLSRYLSGGFGLRERNYPYDRNILAGPEGQAEPIKWPAFPSAIDRQAEQRQRERDADLLDGQIYSNLGLGNAGDRFLARLGGPTILNENGRAKLEAKRLEGIPTLPKAPY